MSLTSVACLRVRETCGDRVIKYTDTNPHHKFLKELWCARILDEGWHLYGTICSHNLTELSVNITTAEPAGSAGSWGLFEQNKGNKDGFLHGLILLALSLPGGFSGQWGHTRWVTRWVTMRPINQLGQQASQLIVHRRVEHCITEKSISITPISRLPLET